MKKQNTRQRILEEKWAELRPRIMKRWRVCLFYAHSFKMDQKEFQREARYSPTFGRFKIRMGEEKVRPLEDLMLWGFSRWPD